jgi:centromeric protein E
MSSSGNINDIYDDSDLLDYDDSNNENDHDNDDESYNNNYNYTTGHHSKQPLTTDRSTMSSPTTSRSVTATPTVDNRRRTIFPHNKGSNNGNGNYSSSYRSKLSVATPLRKGAGTSGSFYDGNDNGNRNGNGNGSISNNAPSPPPQTYSPPKSPKRDKPQNRKTKIQVCVRVRPILPSDHKKGPSGPSSPNRHKSDLLPPTSDGKRATVKAKSSRHMSLSSAPNTPNSTPNKKGSNGSGGRNSNNNKNNHNNRSRSSSRDRKDIIDTEPAWAVKNNNVSQALHTNPDMARTNDYTFDHTFGPKDDTHQMYQSAVQDCVLSTMEGYHASVFAYGQTATGKTYTMSGKGGMKNYNPDNPSSQGIIQLAIDDCFNYIYNQKSDTREYLLRVSFMEIYNEVINDLLASPPPGKHTTFSSSAMNSPPPAAPSTIRIFESKNEGVIIRGLKEEIVTCSEQVYALLAAGERRRQTGSTILNKQSSRSHSIFRLIVESRRRVPRQQVLSMPSDASSVAESIASSTFAPETTTGKVRVSTLSLVDLAGSESVKNTGSTGVRQKEGQYINKSLLTLGHVIYKLAEMSTKNKSIDEMHIPVSVLSLFFLSKT